MEIKVRFWDVAHGEMLYPPFFTSRDLVENRDWKVMLWICQKDKKGQPIYAGDLLGDDCGNIGVVVWNNSTAQFLVEFEGEAQDLYHPEMWAEVLGNIYQHANLLTQEGK